jgi:fructose-1,6-bisphosphatase/inositol monophosphatase family enzyme
MIDEIGELLKQVAAEAILPLFRRLADADIFEKSPGEIVTTADGKAEEMIAAELLRRYPDVRVVGEEGCAASPARLDGLDRGSAWLLDPLDGTANFAAGHGPFAIMLARLEDGEGIASWMYDPLSGELCAAERGSGAWRDGRRIRTDQESRALSEMKGANFSHFMADDLRRRIGTCLAGVRPLAKLLCSGAEYPDIAAGGRHLSLFWRTLPWDHVPGALFLEEAGGHVCRLDGSPYRAHDSRTGLLVARNRGIAETVLAALAAQSRETW